MARKRVRLKAESVSSSDGWSLDDAITVNRLSANAQPEYVAWIDLMGARGWMAGSIRKAAEIIGVIHIAGLRAARDHKIKAYPVIDGVYLVGDNKGRFKAATNAAMRSLAITFLSRKSADRFLVRGGIAFGRVLHGADIAPLHRDLKEDAKYSSCLAVGVAIGQAYAAESKAPPFGYYVDMTARSTASVDEFPYASSFHRWWSMKDQQNVVENFGLPLEQHFAFLVGRHREMEYEIARLNEHRALASEYFRLPEAKAAGS